MPLRRGHSPLPVPISSRWSVSTITTTSSSTTPSIYSNTTDEDEDDISVLFASKFQYYIPHLSTSDTAFYTASEELLFPDTTTNNNPFEVTDTADTFIGNHLVDRFGNIELPLIEDDGWSYYPRSVRREMAFYGFSDKKNMRKGRRIEYFIERVLRKCEWFGWRKKHGLKAMWGVDERLAIYGCFIEILEMFMIAGF
ncbi:hypothetical protein DM02DRAFT_622622 [Periconia macrospinosa]|uniref:Uncharacterized protein n=1 Tax=Periconia macrospinosa TaxID=97972 RepID=A0A2V1E9I1_9PLEO|nr:hypothetical protein DM02DRAFT_622622 [Periconia macrospinosa]